MIITDLLKELGIPFVTHGESSKVTQGWIGLKCPFCRHVSKNGDANLLGINLRTGTCSCWNCSVHRPGEALAALTGKSLSDCLRLLGETDKTYVRDERPSGTLKLPSPRGPLGPAHRRYLTGRGFDPDEIAATWGIEATGINFRVPWSVVIPVADRRGRVVSWTSRRVSDQAGRRYLAARPEEESVPLKSLCYGMNLVKHACIVVEGPLDAWAVGPGAVALMGTGYTRSQVAAIAEVPVRVICLDAEPDAQKRAESLCRVLQVMPGTTVRAEIESAGDPAGCLASHSGRREINELRKRFLT